MRFEFALVLIVVGLPGAVWPYEVARFGEQIDAIGSKRAASEVKPTDWNVTITRLIGGGMVAIGVTILLVVAWDVLIA